MHGEFSIGPLAYLLKNRQGTKLYSNEIYLIFNSNHYLN